MKKTINKLFIGITSLFMLTISLSGCSIISHTHSFNKGVVSKEATCTSEGKITYSCENGDWEYSEIIPALGHQYERTILTEATCTNEGKGYDKCSRCGNVVNVTIPALGHDFSKLKSAKVEATCLKNGKEAIYECIRCDETKGGETIKALGHDYGEWKVTQAATCANEGMMTRTCSRGDHVETKAIPATGNHNFNIEGVGGICSTCSTPYFTKGLTFTKSSSTYYVSGYNGSSSIVVVPSTYLGLKVTSISSGVFRNNTNITNVTLGDNITSIGSNVFYNATNLSYIDLNNVTSIGNSAFYNCNKLVNINLSTVTSLGKEAFKLCSSLTNITLSSSLTTISESCFENDTSLTSITIPASVNKINKYAFKGSGLTSATFVTTTGWILDTEALKEDDVKNTSTMAIYLKGNASQYEWKRS